MTNGLPAVAVFTPCQQSHGFEERRIPLTEDFVKIGRSVARFRPGTDNAIFDCKVLSRNHAVIWYEDQKFYLKDTKSSNGTFVNNQRLSKGSEESPPKEICSGDIVQLGVDIIENAKKVTHGCIVAMVRLFHPDGSESISQRSSGSDLSQTSTAVVPAAGVGSSAGVSSSGACLTMQELFQLQQYLKEAGHREQMLEQKLASLQGLILSTQEASESSWNALIDEDRLLSRIEMLEAQLQCYSKNATEDKLREECVNLHEEKLRYESVAKESLRRALQEKVEAVQKLSDVERALETTEEECCRLREQCETSQEQLRVLGAQHSELITRAQELASRLEETDRRCGELENQNLAEKAEWDRRLQDMSRQEGLLTNKIESLQADNDFSKEQLAAMKVRMEQVKEQEVNRGAESEDERIQQLSLLLKETQMQLENYKTQLKGAETDEGHMHGIQDELRRTQEKLHLSNRRACVIEDRLNTSSESLDRMVEQAVADLTSQLDQAVIQKRNNEELMGYLKEVASQLENRLKGMLHAQLSNGHISGVENGFPAEDSSVMKDSSYESLVGSMSHRRAGTESEDYDITLMNGSLSSEAEVNRLLQAARMTELELEKYKDELEHSQRLYAKGQEEVGSLRKQIQHTEQLLSQSTAHSQRVQDHLSKEQELKKAVYAELDQLKVQLGESQACKDQNVSEAQELKKKLQLVTEELEFEKSLRTTSSMDNDNARMALHRQAAKNQAEFAALKEECSNLRTRIMAIETEMKTSRKEASRLAVEKRQIQEAHENLLRVKENLEKNESTWKYQADSAKYEADMVRNQLNEAQEELTELRKKRLEQDSDIRLLRRRLEDSDYDFDYEELSLRARVIGICSSVPLLILLFAFFVAFLPFFSRITATDDSVSSL